jgi:hypothetical protein
MRRILLVCGAVLTVGALGACSNSGGGSTGDAALHPVPKEAAGAPSAATGDTPARPGIAGGGSSEKTLPGDSLLLDTGARIRTADMTVAIAGAKNVATMANKADDIATTAGGEIDADERTSGKYASATLRLRVPPTQLFEVLSDLAKLGEEKTRQVSSKDVTEQVADVNSRVASAREAIARLRSLYDHATKVADVISIESELGQRESDLESLQAQQRALSRQTAMASVTLNLQTKPVTKPHEKEQKKKDQGGFLGGLSRGWDAFVGGAGAVATGIGAALPFLVLLVLLAGALRLVWPRLRHSTPPRAPAPSE